MKTIGIDIGTTSICAVLVHTETGEQLDAKTIPNSAGLKTKENWEKLQDPEQILSLCRSLIAPFLQMQEEIVCIGVTGQMHGILYLDKDGKAVSPLYTWQDERGNLIFQNGKSYSNYLTEQSGYQIASGFGIVTHFYNEINHLIPEKATVFCTIADYVAMKLGEETIPSIHPSMAASIGMYHLEKGEFDQNAIEQAGVQASFLPTVSQIEKLAVYSKGAIPVAVAIGDNQSSFLGSVGTESKMLVNVGTGSQISVCTETMDTAEEVEFRPYFGGTFLCVGSSLCGGYSYMLLRNFFEEVILLFQENVPEEIYQTMNRAAERIYTSTEKVTINTQFNGTRKNPKASGSISNLKPVNFHPEHFILGILSGIPEELYHLYEKMPVDMEIQRILVASGNGVRMNSVLQQLLSDLFQMQLKIPRYVEEAAYGCSLYALYAIDYYKEWNELQKLICYD